MTDLVLNLSFSQFKKKRFEKLSAEKTKKIVDELLYRPTDLTLDSRNGSSEGISFMLKSNFLETPVLPEFEALNISVIPKGSMASVMKSSLLEENDVRAEENPNKIKSLQIETLQIESEFMCSGCMTTKQSLLSGCFIT